MQVIVNEQNKAYILKQQVAEGYTLDDKTQVVKNGLVYNKADDAPIAANPTDINNWVPVGTDFSGDISDLDGRIDTIDIVIDKINDRLAIGEEGLEIGEQGQLRVKLAADTETFINGINLDASGGLWTSVYSLREVRSENVEPGFASQYEFSVDGNVVTKINIPKDQFLKSATFHATAEEGVAVEAPYLKFVWDLDINPDLEGIQNVTYVPVKDLVDTYTAGDHITITDNAISVNVGTLTTTIKESIGYDSITTNISNLQSTVGNADSGLVADVAKNAADISAHSSSISENTRNIGIHTSDLKALNLRLGNIETSIDQGIVNAIDNTAVSGINLVSTEDEAGKVTAKINVDIDTLATAVIEAANIPDPIASNITVSAFGTTYTADTNVQAVLESLDSRIKAAVSGGVTSVVAGVGINVNATDANNPTVSVKTSDLVVSGSALTVTDNKIDLCWTEL